MRSGAFLACAFVATACGRADFDLLHDAAIDAGDASTDPVGCADGTREAFVDLAQFPKVAGCNATWTGGHDLRAAATGAGCGDALGVCTEPADACSPGWHVCGLAGDPTEISMRVTASDCTNAVGAFAIAFGHCSSFTPPSTCSYAANYPCTAAPYCAEAVCCGTTCAGGNGCADAVFPGATVSVGSAGYCNDVSSNNGLTGVMCCTG